MASVECVQKITTIRVKVVELGSKSPDTKNSSGNCWEGGNEMAVGACFMDALLPRPIISGGFSPIGRKVLFVMTGAAAVGVSTRLRTQVYGSVSIGYENVFP